MGQFAFSQQTMHARTTKKYVMIRDDSNDSHGINTHETNTDHRHGLGLWPGPCHGLGPWPGLGLGALPWAFAWPWA